MKLVTKVALLLVMCVVLLAAVQKGNADKAKCLAACQDKCTKSYTTCMKNAKTDAARTSCAKSKQTCDADCVNKACR